MKKTLPLVLALFAVLLVGGLAYLLRSRAPTPAVAPPTPGAEVARAAASGDGTSLDAVVVDPATGAPVAPERQEAVTAARRSTEAIEDFELRDGHWVTGRVELAEGTPLDEEAYVVAAGREFEHRPLHRARVGPDGTFKVAFSKDTRLGWLRLDARYNYLEEPPPVRVDKPVAEIVLKAKLGGCVRGRILLDADAQSYVADVRAGRALAGENEFGFLGFGQKEGHVHDDLTYEIGGLEPGTGRHLTIQAEGFVDGKSGPFDVNAGRVDARDVELHLGAVVAGRVVGVDHAPIAGVSLRPHYSEGGEGRFWTMMEHTVKSDEQGAFTLRGLSSGKLTVVAQKPGFSPVFHEVGAIVPATRMLDLQVELGLGLAIAGKVQLENGKVPGHAVVDVIDDEESTKRGMADGMRWLLEDREPVTVAADGSFRVQGLLPGRYTVTALGWDGADAAAEAARAKEDAAAEASGGVGEVVRKARKVKKRAGAWSARVENVSAGAEDMLVVLTRGDRLRGRAVDGEGKPIERFLVHAEPDRSSPGFTDDIDGFEKSFRDKNGNFVLEGLRPCGWDIHVTARGYMPSSTTKVTVPGTAADTTFTLLRLAKLTGVVLDPERRPVAGAKVIAGSDPSSWEVDRASARTDEKGQFTLVSVPLGAIRVHAEANGFVRSESLRLEVSAASVVPNVELALTRGGVVRGVVTDADGKPAAAWSVRVDGVGEDYDKSTRTDAEGKFSFEAVPPGRYRVTARASDDKMNFAALGADFERGVDPGLQRVVDLRDGQSVDVSLGRTPRAVVRLRGHVRGASEGALLSARRAAGASDFAASRFRRGVGLPDADSPDVVKVAADGAYEITLSSPGAWRVTIQSGDKTHEFLVEVPSVAEFERDFALPSGRVRGRVVNAEGEPVAGMAVRLHSGLPAAAYSRGTDVVDTGSDGTFAFESLEDGTYSLRTEGYADWWNRDTSRARGHARREGIVVRDAGTVEDVELVLGADGTLRGAVRGTNGAWMPNARIFVFDADGHALDVRNGGANSDGAGRFRIEDLPPGRVFLVANTPHGAGKAATIVREDEDVDVEVALRPSARLIVNPQDASGAPTFALLSVVDEDGRRLDEADFRADDEVGLAPGSQAFSGLPAGRYTVTAHGQDATGASWTARKEVRASEGGRVELTLRPSP